MKIIGPEPATRGDSNISCGNGEGLRCRDHYTRLLRAIQHPLALDVTNLTHAGPRRGPLRLVGSAGFPRAREGTTVWEAWRSGDAWVGRRRHRSTASRPYVTLAAGWALDSRVRGNDGRRRGNDAGGWGGARPRRRIREPGTYGSRALSRSNPDCVNPRPGIYSSGTSRMRDCPPVIQHPRAPAA